MSAKRTEPPPEVDRLARGVIGAALEVHRILGPGFLESLYEEALAVEMQLREIPFSRQHPVNVSYKGHRIGEARLDFLIGEKLVVELKAVDAVAPVHYAQVIAYLKARQSPLGLLINFNVAALKDGIRRIVLSV